jgi:hypothetical protein
LTTTPSPASTASVTTRRHFAAGLSSGAVDQPCGFVERNGQRLLHQDGLARVEGGGDRRRMLGRGHKHPDRLDGGIGDQVVRVAVTAADPEGVAHPCELPEVTLGNGDHLHLPKATQNGQVDMLGDIPAADDAEPQGAIRDRAHEAGDAIGSTQRGASSRTRSGA